MRLCNESFRISKNEYRFCWFWEPVILQETICYNSIFSPNFGVLFSNNVIRWKFIKFVRYFHSIISEGIRNWKCFELKYYFDVLSINCSCHSILNHSHITFRFRSIFRFCVKFRIKFLVKFPVKCPVHTMKSTFQLEKPQ